jgi:hypothetical protein
MKTTVIHHSADFDGIFCREIARKFLPEAELIGWDWADPKIPAESFVPFSTGEPVYILDLSPGCFSGTIPVQNLIWIDHHKSAIDEWSGAIPGYRIDGVAACRLAWQWFQCCDGNWPAPRSSAMAPAGVLPMIQDYKNRTVNEPIAVRLAGEYDIWDKRDPNAELFQHGLRSQELRPADWGWLLSLEDPFNVVETLLRSGTAVQYAQKRQDEFVAKNRSFDVKWEGLNFMAINAVRCNSQTFEAATRPDHDALMGFYWNGKVWNVSLYHAPHRKDLDLSAIATKYGGGGHKGACGFRVDKLPFIP